MTEIVLTPSNASHSQNAYIGAVSVSGAGSYTPIIVIGQQTGSNAYNERMRIDTSGNVGIGTAVPAYLLHVGSTSASGIVAEFQNSSGACTFSPGASAISTSCSSDIRLKSDIQDAGDALAWLDGMRVRDFTVKTTGERRTGVIAQELLQTRPDMVHMGPDGFYRVDEPNPWILVKAVQQLKADNDNLKAASQKEEAEIEALRTRLDALEAGR